MTGFNVSLSLEGIGPHIDTEFDENVSSLTMAIYAENGSGKSFISKSFKRISDLRIMESGNEDELKAKTSAMVRFGEDKGVMHFCITEPNKSSKSLDIVFENDTLPQISDGTNLIYHVFNSEYVRENLEAVKYKPEDNVSGFILGKVNIDLSKEKQLLESYKTNIENLKKSIEQNIKDGKNRLRELQIQSNTSEFIKITYENIKTLKPTDENEEFNVLESRYSKLLNMPSTIEDVTIPQFPDTNRINQLLTAINELLLKEYSLSRFADEFKEKVKAKQLFIETGLKFYDGERCPFCGQVFNKDASNLIDMYTAFLKDEEAKVVNDIISKQKDLQNIIDNFRRYVELHKISATRYDSIKIYFPSIENTRLTPIDIETLIITFDTIIKALEWKKQNISKSYSDIDDTIKKVETLTSRLFKDYINNNNLIRKLNNNKNDINKERLALRKALCNAKFNSIIDISKKLFNEMNTLEENSQKLKKEIEDKESQAKIDRRKMLVNELKYYLTLFFADKYDFDEDKFCISFQNKALVTNTDDVLSDGEKSILAFCFYLANIHGIVNKTEDYNRILFVIDDPVSSMDFNYVYNVAQVIRGLKKHNRMERIRYIILTHSMEFMSILVRNKIVSKKCILSHGKFTDFKNNYIMPYTYNLMDIYSESISLCVESFILPDDESKAVSVLNQYNKFLYDNCHDKKCLIFTNSRQNAEKTIGDMKREAEKRNESDVFYVHHGSVSAELRKEAETALKENEGPTVAAATLTLELGIDIGDLDSTIQLGAPFSCSSFVQRLGRSGRRTGKSQMMFLNLYYNSHKNPLEAMPWSLLCSIAIIQLYLEERWVEPFEQKKKPFSLLAHQTLSMLMSCGELTPSELARKVLLLPAFKGIVSADEYRELLKYMLEKEYLQRMENGGVIVGLLGEKICNYFTFYAVFQDEETYKVLSKTGEIGTLDNCPALGEVFVLAGRSWVVISVDEERKSIYVNPTKSSRIPIWNGSGGSIHEKIFKRIKKVLQEDIIYTYLRPNAIQLLTDSRKAARESGILEHDIIQFSENAYHICPWTGTKELATISNLFSYRLKEQLDIRSVEGGFGYLTFRSGLEKKELINCLMNLKIDQNNPDMVLTKDAAPKKDKYDYMVPGNLLRSAYLYNQVDVKSANNILNNLIW